jgi:radical SAM protein with 4Fe4S-binding SPASM domain
MAAVPRAARRLFDRATRRLALVGRLAETWARRPPSPTRLVLDVTRRCNLRCTMCRSWRAPAPSELDAREIAALLGALPRLVWLDVTGGEPFVRSDIGDVLAAAIDSPPSLRFFHFQTNGWLTDRIVAHTERARARRDAIDFVVTVSLDGPPAVHDAIRGKRGAFARAIETAVALRSIAGVDVHVGTTVMQENAQHLDELGELLARRGFPAVRWHLNWLQTSAHFFDNADLRGRAAAAPERALAHARRRGAPRSLIEAMELAYLVNLAFVLRGEPSGVPCQALRSTLFVSPEGDVYPCHVWDRPLGNLREHDIAELWRSEQVRRARAEVERLDCGGCFSACEAYPALAGAPLHAAAATARRIAAIVLGGAG